MTSQDEIRLVLDIRKRQRDAQWCREQVSDEFYRRALEVTGYVRDLQAEAELVRLLRQ